MNIRNLTGLFIGIAIVVLLMVFMMRNKQRTKEGMLQNKVNNFKLSVSQLVSGTSCTTTTIFDNINSQINQIQLEYDAIVSSTFADSTLLTNVKNQLNEVKNSVQILQRLPTCQSLCLEASYDSVTNSCVCPTGMWGVTGTSPSGTVVYCQGLNCSRISNSYYNRISASTGTCECQPGYIYNSDRTACNTCGDLLVNSYLDTTTNSCICGTGYFFKDNLCKSIATINNISLTTMNASLTGVLNTIDSYGKYNPANNPIPGNITGYNVPVALSPAVSKFLPFYNNLCLTSSTMPTVPSPVIATSVEDCAKQTVIKPSKYFAVGVSSTGVKCIIGGNQQPSGYVGTLSNTCSLRTDGYNSGSIDSYATYVINKYPLCYSGYVASNFTCISSGSVHNMAIRADGTLWGWGSNAYGQLGNGTTTDQLTSAVQIGTDKWLMVVCGNSYTMGIKIDGTLWGWGINTNGQLGIGNTTSPITFPTATNTTERWKTVSCCIVAVAGITTNGSLYHWGKISATTNTTSPQQVPGSSAISWNAVSIGSYSLSYYLLLIALDTSGKLYSYGGPNTYGQLGNASAVTSSLSTITQISTSNTFKAIATKAFTCIAIHADGTLWTWGYGGGGALGNGGNTDVSTPVKINTDTDWNTVWSSDYNSFAMKNNRSVWGCGENYAKQIADTTTNQYFSLQQIKDSTTFTVLMAVGLTNVISTITETNSFATNTTVSSTFSNWGKQGAQTTINPTIGLASTLACVKV